MPITKGYQQLVAEAMAQVTTYSVAEVQARLNEADTQLVDIRDIRELTEGTVVAPVSLTARAITTPPSATSNRRFANTWNAASLPTALPVPAVMIADTTFLSHSPARVVGCVRRATPGAWWRRRRI